MALCLCLIPLWVMYKSISESITTKSWNLSLQLRTHFFHMNLQMVSSYEWYLGNPKSISWLCEEHLPLNFTIMNFFWKYLFPGIINLWVLKLANPLHLRYDYIAEIVVSHCPLNKSMKLGIKSSKFSPFDFITIEIKVGLHFQATKKTSNDIIISQYYLFTSLSEK